jgi:hypothetical protein
MSKSGIKLWAIYLFMALALLGAFGLAALVIQPFFRH